MPAKIYKAYNAPSPTTAAFVGVTTGTVIKTMLQIATPATEMLRVVEYGISFNGSAAGTPIKVELIDTDVAATVTAHVAAGIVKLNTPNDVASLMTLGTAATGYTATAEGAITAARLLDARYIAPTDQFTIQYPLGREPEVAASRFLRLRVHAPAAVDANCFIVWEE